MPQRSCCWPCSSCSPCQGFAVFPGPLSVDGIYNTEYDDVLAFLGSEAALTELDSEPAAALTPLLSSVSRVTGAVASRLAFSFDPVRAPPTL